MRSSGAWDARWIWLGLPASVPRLALAGSVPPEETWNAFRYFRRAFTLDNVPVTALARVTADSRYVLYVNGAEVSRGPARAIPERIAYDELDLAPFLGTGDNVVAALARFYGRPGPWWRPAAPTNQLGFGSFALEAPTLGLRTDETWKARVAPYKREVAIPLHGLATEDLEGSEVPWGWAEVGFEDGSWESAQVVEGTVLGVAGSWPGALPYARPEPSRIAPLTKIGVELRLLREGVVRPSDASDPITALEAGTSESGDTFWTYDAGRLTLATPWVEMRGSRGAIVDVYSGEDVREDGVCEVQPRNYALRYQLAGRDAERIEGFEAVGFRYLTVVTRGDAELAAVGAIERRYPRGEGAAFFCDNDRLNAIWETGARTLDLCSTDAFLDCPGREQRAWLGDAYVHGLVTYVTNTDWRLVARHLRVAAQGQRGDGLLPMSAVGDLSLISNTIPDYSLHWLRMLARHYDYAGDAELMRELLPVAAGIVSFFEGFRGEDGLLHHVPGWVFVDWAQTERAEITAALDALYALALEDYARLLEVVGDGVGARRAREGAEGTRAGFELLWDARRGVYVDAADAGVPRRRVSQQTNAVAILSGCARRGRWDSILRYVFDTERLVRTLTPADGADDIRRLLYQWDEPPLFDADRDVVLAQPFFSHFVHQAVAQAGRGDLLDDLCLRWWPQVERGNTTFEEYWDAQPGSASRCHAWSATPTYDLTTHVLGVRLAAPGYARAEIRPRFGRLRRLGGRVPTPHGLIELDLTCDGGGLRLPDGVMARVAFEDAPLVGGEFGPGSHKIGSRGTGGSGTSRLR